MFKVLLVIIVILAVFLCFIVTIQNSKGEPDYGCSQDYRYP